MVLVDTSVWVAHLREGTTGLKALLLEGRVLCHPFIISELACGNLQRRSEILSHLSALPRALPAKHDEILEFIDNYRLMGQGLGYVDMHLLGSALLTGVPLWTLDKKLSKIVGHLGLAP